MAGMALLLVLAAVVGVTSAQVDRGVVPTVSAPSAKDVVQSAFTNTSKTSTSRNPCRYMNGGCHKDAICSTDDQGEATCTCPPSHTGDGKNCTQLEGCYPGRCGDNATCLEDGRPGLFTCVCNEGFVYEHSIRYSKHFEHTAPACVEIKPCQAHNGGCHPHASCTHVGPGNRSCTCNEGYTGSGAHCAEIDFCRSQERGHCSANATCSKTGPGLVKCTCNLHYTGDGETCKALDACQSMHDCHPDAECQNLGRGFSTCVCKEGHAGNGFGSGGCEPINVCETHSQEANTCHDHASCVYTGPMQHSCKCNNGFVGNGVKSTPEGTGTGCTAMNPCNSNFGGCDKEGATCDLVLPPVYDKARGEMKLHKCVCKEDHIDVFHNGSKCEQINYCTNNNNVSGFPVNAGCHHDAVCKHLAPRQFECVCKPGFSGDGKRCEAADACQVNFGGCHPTGAKCIYHGPGSSSCRCLSGYSGDGKNCTQICKISDADCKHGSQYDSKSCSCQNCFEPWVGPKCDVCNTTARTCANGGTLNPETCACERCEKPWGGETCDSCTLTQSDCKNGGKLNERACMCKCEANWGGDQCDDCILTTKRTPDQVCLHKGNFSAEDCTCTTCPYPWGGELCERCERDPESCPSGSKLNTMTCKCDECPKGWGGDICDKCIRTEKACSGRGKMNPFDCKCEDCQNGWEGDFCEICTLKQKDCASGVLDSETCSCKNCDDGFNDGYLCTTCSRQPEDCQNGGVLNRGTCRCSCQPPYTGKFCTECGLNASDCLYGSKLNMSSCVCSDCEVPGASDLCSICSMTPDMCKHGKLNRKTCQCQECFPFKGKTCSECGLKPTDCRHGSKLDSSNCRCVRPEFKNTKAQSCETKVKSLIKQHKSAAQIQAECEGAEWAPGQACSYTAGTGGKHFCSACPDADPQTGKCPKDFSFCPAPYGGIICSNCLRKDSECKHGKIDPRTCQCVCQNTARWGGPACDQCQRDSTYGCSTSANGYNASGCDCGKCVSIALPKTGSQRVARYSGDNCRKCALVQANCVSGVVNIGECRCVNCAANRSGLLCENCDLSPSECPHGKIVDCKCTCEEGWMGDDCSKPRCVDDCNQQGTCTRSKDGKMAACQCKPGFAGPSCERKRGVTMSPVCYSVGMKHTTTFDGDVFDDYNAGEYLMYLDPEDPFEEQIHVLQAKYARKTGIYGVAIRRNASVSTNSGQDSVIFAVPETLGRKVGSKMNKASILYGCSSEGPLRSYTSYVGKAGSAGYEFPNGVVVVRTNAWQYEVKTPSGLFLLIDSYYNGDQQYFNTYLSVKAPAGSFSPKGYCGNYNGDASDDDITRPAADGINFVDPKSNAISYKKGRKSLFVCSGELDIRHYGVESQDKSVSTCAAKYQMVSRSGTQGDFAKTFSALAEKSAVDGTESVDAAKYCEQHKEQIMNMLDQTDEASMKAHLTYLHSNSGYQTAWNACSKVCGGRYKPQFPDYPKPKNPICRHCIVDQCSQMEATEGGSTIGGNAARAASSLAKFETRLTSEQAF